MVLEKDVTISFVLNIISHIFGHKVADCQGVWWLLEYDIFFGNHIRIKQTLTLSLESLNS